MSKPLCVEKSAFDAALGRLLKTEPMKREEIRITNKKPATLIPPKK